MELHDICAICIEPLGTKEASDGMLVSMPGCKHVFHVKCFFEYVGFGGSTCPVCRNVVIKAAPTTTSPQTAIVAGPGRALAPYHAIQVQGLEAAAATATATAEEQSGNTSLFLRYSHKMALGLSGMFIVYISYMYVTISFFGMD
jgi:hypothetical protein